MRKEVIYIILVFFLGLNHISSAQQTVSVSNFNHFASAQENSNWCWAASMEMIFNYYGVSISQEQIVARSYGVSPNGNLPNWTANLQVVTKNLNNWGIDNDGRRYIVFASLNKGAPTPSYLIRQLSAGRPVLIGYRSSRYSSHAVVITGVDYVKTAYGMPIIQSISVIDPWPSRQNISNNGHVKYPGTILANRIFAHWYINVR